jgi:hypothetical protein
MSKIDRLIKEAKEGKRVLQNICEGFTYYLVYLCEDFFIEKYVFNIKTQEYEFYGVECVDEATARFSLTALYL